MLGGPKPYPPAAQRPECDGQRKTNKPPPARRAVQQQQNASAASPEDARHCAKTGKEPDNGERDEVSDRVSPQEERQHRPDQLKDESQQQQRNQPAGDLGKNLLDYRPQDLRQHQKANPGDHQRRAEAQSSQPEKEPRDGKQDCHQD